MMVQSSADRDLRLMSKDLWPLRDYLNNAVRAQERRADGGRNGAGQDGSEAPVTAAFRWPVALVEREGLGESGRNGPAGN